MRIVVYGAGAVGCFYGGLLARAKHDVRFVARGAQLEALHERGLHISSELLGELTIRPIDVSASASDFGTADLVLVCVKAHQTDGVLGDMEEVVGPRTLIMALQNGIDADRTLAERFARSGVVTAVVYVGAALESPGIVHHAARGTLMLGSRCGVPDERVEALAEQLTVPGLRMRVVPDIDRQLWYKLMWNTSFNAVSALTLQETQPLLRTPAPRDVIIRCMREVVAVAQAEGVALTSADVDQSIADTEALTSIRTSMLDDRERGREMETEALVGAVVRRGAAAGVPTPVTSVLYALLKGIDTARPSG